MWNNFLLHTNEGLLQLKLWWWGTRVALPTFAVLLGIWSFTNFEAFKELFGEERLITLQTAPGKQQRIQLSDSSVVFLAGGSKFVYPKTFRGKQTRISLIYGHGFFEVAKDASKPFLVESGSIQIKVLVLLST